MDIARIPPDELVRRLSPPDGRVRVALDTDTYNEVDDQFALAYAMLSPRRVDLEAVYAAPFYNARSSGPGDGMEKSYAEILRLLDMMGADHAGFAFRGSVNYITDNRPQPSDAAGDLVKRAMSGDGRLYVVAIGAPTNVASAILMEPEIINKIVVVWLGGHALYWRDTGEFNMRQDIAASRILLDSGVPLVLLPCMGVVSHMITTAAELDLYLSGKNALADYLAGIVKDYAGPRPAASKVLWDIAAVAWLINDKWTPSDIVASPVLGDDCRWSFDPSRHFIRCVSAVNRDAIFADVFGKLAAWQK